MLIKVDNHAIEIADQDMKRLANVSVDISNQTPTGGTERIQLNFDTALVEDEKK